MAKLILDDVQSNYASLATLNDNFAKIEQAIENTLSRDGSVPNQMNVELDMNGRRIINLPSATAPTEPVTFGQWSANATTVQFNGTAKQTIIATAGQTIFTLSTITYTPGLNNLSIYVNGLKQVGSDYVETSTSTVTFVEALNLNDKVEFVINEQLVDSSFVQDSTVTYTPEPANSIQRNVRLKLRETLSTKDFGAVGDGVTNDYAAIMRAHDNAPEGSTILVKGATRFTTPLVFTRRLNWVCESIDDYFKPALLTTQDAITMTGSTTVAGMDWKINMFSAASSCQNGLVLRNMFQSRVDAWVQVGASAYAFQTLGCLESQFRFRHGANFTTPLGSPQLAINHLKVDFYGVYKNNACYYDVFFAGASNGVLIADQVNEGDNSFTGTIQGLTGTPFSATNCDNLRLSDMHFEGNAVVSGFSGCSSLSINNVLNLTSNAFELTNCVNSNIEQFVGSLTITSTNLHTRVNGVRLPSGATYTDSSISGISTNVTNTSTSAAASGGSGMPPMENLFHNPLVDIWSAGSAAAPDGFSIVSGSFAREVGVTYPGNYRAVSAFVTSTATSVADSARLTLKNSLAESTWYSLLIPVYIQTGQPDLLVQVWNGGTHVGGELVTTKNAWVLVRTVVKVAGGIVPYVAFSPWSGSAVIAGNFIIGGGSAVLGTVAPKHLHEGPARQAHIVTSVANTPAFIGQRALVGTTFYMAAGTASSADWKALN